MAASFPRQMNVAPALRTFAIAIAYSRPPFPMNRADQMTVAHLIAFLHARGHAIDLYSLDSDLPMSAEQHEWLQRRCRAVAIFPHGPARRLWGVFTGLLRGLPLQIGWFANPAQNRAVRAGLSQVDVGYCYYIRSAEPMRGHGRLPGRAEGPATFLAMQLSQSLNTRRMAQHYRDLKEKMIYAVESRLVRRYEPRVWSGFTRTVLIGQRDVDEIAALCRSQGLPVIDNVVFGPHGVDVERFAPKPEIPVEPFTLIFSGVLGTYTNVHAITWFADAVWPLVLAGEPRAKLLVVGRKPRPEVRALGERAGITVTGEVPDPADYIARAAICVNPVRVGAGMQNKLIEYMAMEKPIVATSVANEGIEAVAGEHLVLADDAETFASEILALLADSPRRENLGRAARAYVTEHWTWEAHFLKLEAAMLAAVDERAISEAG